MDIFNVPIDCLVEIINKLPQYRDIANLLSTCKSLYNLDLSNKRIFNRKSNCNVTRFFASKCEKSFIISYKNVGISAAIDIDEDDETMADLAGIIIKQNLKEYISSFKNHGNEITFREKVLEEKTWRFKHNSRKLTVRINWAKNEIIEVMVKYSNDYIIWKDGKIDNNFNLHLVNDLYRPYFVYCYQSIMENFIGKILFKSLLLLEKPESSPKF